MFRGRIRGGVVVLQPGTHLPEGTDVTVSPLGAGPDAREPMSATNYALRNGVPVFPQRDGAMEPGLGLVNELRDEMP